MKLLPVDRPDLSPWGLDTQVTDCRRPARGTNNDVRIVRTADGAFVWRLQENLSLAQVEREHLLLQWLTSRELSFRVPVPVRTSTGLTYATAASGRAMSVHALIPGRRPDDSDAEIAMTATAFGELLSCLADAPAQLAPRDWSTTRLRDIHEGVTDPEDFLDRLAGTGADLGWLRDTLDAEDDVHGAIRALPHQIVHGDVAQSNAVTDGTRITGLLDFEIAGWDARITDVGTALLSLGGDPATAAARGRVAALRDRLGSMLQLQDRELQLLPEVVRQRLAGSVFWRGGRWLQGLSDVREVLDRVRDGGERIRHLQLYAPTVRSHRSA